MLSVIRFNRDFSKRIGDSWTIQGTLLVNTPLTIDTLERAMRIDELVLYYQPKVCLLQGKVLGAEALVR